MKLQNFNCFICCQKIIIHAKCFEMLDFNTKNNYGLILPDTKFKFKIKFILGCIKYLIKLRKFP